MYAKPNGPLQISNSRPGEPASHPVDLHLADHAYPSRALPRSGSAGGNDEDDVGVYFHGPGWCEPTCTRGSRVGEEQRRVQV
jgi:hypothetical protein